MNPREMLRQLLATLEHVTSSGEMLSDELQGEIARTLGILYDRIQSESPVTNLVETGSKLVGPNIPAGADLLWVLSGGDVNTFVNYLRTFPGPGLLQLAQDPVRLNQAIEHLQQVSPIPPSGMGTDGIPNAQMQSSNVVGFRYDSRNQRMLVKFHGDTIEPVYQYDGVPPAIATLLMSGAGVAKTNGRNRWGQWWRGKTPSLGTAVNQYLKVAGFPYQRIT